MWHFNKKNPLVLFGDIREEELELCDGRTFSVSPDIFLDFTDMNTIENESFYHVAFDPPHLLSHRIGEKAWMRKKYGALNKDEWYSTLKKGFAECWRVLKPNGTLVFKWCEQQIKISEIRSCFPASPIYGTRSRVDTLFLVFVKAEGGEK